MIPAEPWPYPLVKVIWKDAETDDSSWFNIDTYDKKLPLIYTVGWLVKERDDHYVISATLGSKWEGDMPNIDSMGQVFKIPKGMVVEFVTVAKVK